MASAWVSGSASGRRWRRRSAVGSGSASAWASGSVSASASASVSAWAWASASAWDRRRRGRRGRRRASASASGRRRRRSGSASASASGLGSGSASASGSGSGSASASASGLGTASTLARSPSALGVGSRCGSRRRNDPGRGVGGRGVGGRGVGMTATTPPVGEGEVRRWPTRWPTAPRTATVTNGDAVAADGVDVGTAVSVDGWAVRASVGEATAMPLGAGLDAPIPTASAKVASTRLRTPSATTSRARWADVTSLDPLFRRPTSAGKSVLSRTPDGSTRGSDLNVWQPVWRALQTSCQSAPRGAARSAPGRLLRCSRTGPATRRGTAPGRRGCVDQPPRNRRPGTHAVGPRQRQVGSVRAVVARPAGLGERVVQLHAAAASSCGPVRHARATAPAACRPTGTPRRRRSTTLERVELPSGPVDGGRNVGDALLLGRAEEPDRQVEAVEPDPANVADGRDRRRPGRVDQRR